MTTDFEDELRRLFREKAGQAPIAAPTLPADAPRQVLRRGRRHQVGTVLGSAAVALILIVGSVAGLQRILGSGSDPFGTGEYEVFERMATVEAFTVTSPSDWYLVNQWPLSMLIAVEGSGGAASDCYAVPGDVVQECDDTPGETTSSPIPVPHGLPMLQVSNVDLGLVSNACEDGPPAGAAVLYVALDHSRAIEGIADPSIAPWPAELREPGAAGGACGAGRYATFSVNGEPFFAWVGLGEGVSDADRATVTTAFESMEVDDAWEPVQPDHVTPAYVIAGGALRDGEPWRLDLRPGERSPELFLDGVDPALLGVEPGHGQDTVVPSIPVEYCCRWDDGFLDVTFGFVRKEATGVEMSVTDSNGDPTGQTLEGTVVLLPPSLSAFDADLFFIEGTGGLIGEVVALGPDGSSFKPPPVAEPRGEIVELTGTYEGQDWSALFSGAFSDETACIAVTIGGESHGSLCQEAMGDSLAQDQSSMHGWLTSDLHLLTGTVSPDVVEVRFVSDDDAIVPTQFRCAMGPLGWTNPDRKVCAIALPPAGSGTLEYLDAGGTVLFEEGIGWGVAEPEGAAPTPVTPELGGRYWAGYAWVGSGAEEAEIEIVQQRLLEDEGVRGLRGSLSCDEGAAEALGTTADHKVAVYFATQKEANAFALQAGLGDEAGPVVAQVTIVCLE